MLDLGQRIRAIRQNKGLSQAEVEKITGIKREYLSKIENGKLTNPTYNTIQKVCRGINIAIGELLDPEKFSKTWPEPIIGVTSLGITRQRMSQDETDAGEFVCIPIIDEKIATSNPITINDKDIQDYIFVHSHCLRHTNEKDRYRCVRLKKNDQSMSPMIKSGSVVCIDSQQRDPKALDGQIVAMKNNKDCSFRRLRIDQNYLAGVPVNLEYNPIVIPTSKPNLIIGKVVWFRTQLETKPVATDCENQF